ncbi:anaerobic ribonucleoside-triphosphate reductase activating protein [bacterium]|nr:anaerobic ribonucleoside-triphosphate reductase activating protein [bacterium]
MIKGYIGTSLIDFPEKITSIVFFGGCNYRCPFCQNSWLVSEPKYTTLPTLEPEDVLRMIAMRSKMIDGVVFSGGEPTLYPSLLTSLMMELKRNETTGHLKIKLDTNGSHPVILKELLSRNLLDYVAIDLKTSPTRYDSLTGMTNSFEPVKQSIRLLSQSAISSELRTTYVPGLVDKAEITEMLPYICESKRYVIQGFRPKDTLDESYSAIVPYTPEYLTELTDWIRSQVSAEVIQRF